MRGILKSNINNDWFVWYTDIENSSVYEKVLPLIRDFSNWVHYNPTDGLEVEFEIVEVDKCVGICMKMAHDYSDNAEVCLSGCEDIKKVAKLISPKQQIFTQKESNQDYLLKALEDSEKELKQEESSNWDEIMQNWSNLQTQLPFIEYLKKLYNPPVKR